MTVKRIVEFKGTLSAERFARRLADGVLSEDGIVSISDGEGPHLIDLREGGWTIQHPISCRLALGGLFSCPYNRAARQIGPEGWLEGRYEVTLEQGALVVGKRLGA